MKIGIDASRANDDKKTGVGWYAYHTIQEFKKIIPDNVRVVLYSREPLKGNLVKLPDNWESKVLKWSPFGFAQGKPLRLWTQFRLSWEMLFHAPDVLFIPAHVFPIIHPKKTVMTVHDIAAIKFPEAYNWFEKWYTLWSGRIALKKLWKVITISQFTKNELKKEFGVLNLEKVKVIYLGYNKEYEEVVENVDEILKKYKIEKPYLLSIGRLEEKKNTVRIIKAFEKIKNSLQPSAFSLQLVLVGSEGFGYEKVMEVVNNSKFKNDVIIPGWVGNEDLPALMQGAEVFVFPSLYEGFGIPVLEAFSAGIPVVASRGGASEEIGGSACEYVDSMNIDSIVEGIEKVLQNKKSGVWTAESGKQWANNFSWEKCARETWDILLSN
ncbi:MAG: glycosyltransferase family 1 protein [Candidatus Magasanikbacteria bacterium]